jgi:branched-chain amino acid transport system permease protein
VAKTFSNALQSRRTLIGLLLLAGILLPFQPVVYIVLIMKVMCFAMFASAFNLLLGFTGLLSFGHAAFFGTAAYVTAEACRTYGLSPELGILLGTSCAGFLGLVFGTIAIRRGGLAFAMITLALSQVVFFVAVQLPFTNGEDGIQGVPRGRLFGLIDLTNDRAIYYLVLAAFVAVLALVYRIVHSPFGDILQAIRENEKRATSLGYDVGRFKLLAFIISAAISGFAGSIKVLVFQLATLTDVHWHMSGEVVVMSLLGGIGTILGPVIGAVIVIGLQNYLAGAGSWSTITIGAIFMLCVLTFRKGVVGEWNAYRTRRTDPKKLMLTIKSKSNTRSSENGPVHVQRT